MEQHSTLFAVSRSQRLVIIFWLIIAFIGLPMASSFTCYCEGSDCFDDHQNGTCETRKSGYCFSAVEEVWDGSQEKVVLENSFGCLPPGIQGYMQCKGYMLSHFKAKSIVCCKGNFCNKEVVPVPKVEPTMATLPVPAPAPAPAPAPTGYTNILYQESDLFIVGTMILIFWALVMTLLLFTYFLYVLRSNKLCLMHGTDLSDFDEKSIGLELRIFVFGSKGKLLALPYDHIDKNVRVGY